MWNICPLNVLERKTHFWPLIYNMLFFLLRILLPITVQLLMVLPIFRVGFPGGSDSKGMATHSSILSWRIPLTEKPGRLQSLGWQRVRHYLMTSIVTVTTSSEKPSLTRDRCSLSLYPLSWHFISFMEYFIFLSFIPRRLWTVYRQGLCPIHLWMPHAEHRDSIIVSIKVLTKWINIPLI